MVTKEREQSGMSDDLFESLKTAEMMLKQSAEIRQLHCVGVKIAAEKADVSRKLGLSNDAVVGNITTALESTLVPVLRHMHEQMNPDALTSVALGLSAALQTQTAQVHQLPKSMESIVDAFETQNIIIKNAAACVQTPAITALLEACQNQQLTLGMESFLRTFASSKIIEVSDVAFLKNISGLGALAGKRLPYGWKKIIKKMLKPTASRLAQNKDISADINGRCFVVDNAPDISVSVENLNVISSTADLFAGIQESELMELSDKLEWDSPHALECKAGQAIDDIIHSWNSFVDFDCEYYYHSRTYDDGEPFFMESEMRKAPAKYVGNGRYNYSGNSHFYFANTENGAKAEINKHYRNALIQTEKLKPVKHIRMIDLSEENKKKIFFLDYIRKPADMEAKRPPEYRIPQFVCSCCRHADIEGIKYYGSQKYNNYVTWKDDYFEVVGSWR